MDNFRKRQQRLAQDGLQADRERLLRGFLLVVDDLERALATPQGHEATLRQGIELTRRSALRMLQQEGVEPIRAEGRPFDPLWHEAVATTTPDGAGATSGAVVRVVKAGYRLGDQLLRPAQVVVAL